MFIYLIKMIATQILKNKINTELFIRGFIGGFIGLIVGLNFGLNLGLNLRGFVRGFIGLIIGSIIGSFVGSIVVCARGFIEFAGGFAGSFAELFEKIKYNLNKLNLNKLNSKEPNLGGLKLKLLAKDDADRVHLIKINDISEGRIAMPFVHPYFLWYYYESKKSVLYSSVSGKVELKRALTKLVSQLDIITTFAKIRNIRLMKKINSIIISNQKIPFSITQEMENLMDNLPELLMKARYLDINPSIYLDESTDLDDINECTNSWCLNQVNEAGKASDSIRIITDIDNNDWLVLISRKNGPGRNQYAYAGGFVDPGETFSAAAKREKDEETDEKIEGIDTNISHTTTTFIIPENFSQVWDPRAKFVKGMINGATVTHDIFLNKKKN